MKNRLEVARELLRDDGFFWVCLSDVQAHYCKVLMDEVFGRKNFVADIIWNSTKSVTNTAIISDAHTHLLLYSKNIKWLKNHRDEFRLLADESKFSNPDNDQRGKWIADPFQVGGERPNQLYEITNPNTGIIYRPNQGSSWKNEKKVFDKLLADNRIVFGTGGKSAPQRKRFWFEAKKRGRVTTTLWKDLPTTTNGTQHLKKLFGEELFSNPKPEGLMERIIQLSTIEGDIILDYHLGSGTTCAVAHKMRRRYIGIEQMNYIKEVPIRRLQMLIRGEDNGGISKEVNWVSGGSFVYTELAENSQKIIAKLPVKNDKNCVDLWYRLRNNYCVSYHIDFQKVSDEEFEKLNLRDKKKILLNLLDKNMLYVPYGEIDNKDYCISNQDKTLSNQFYKDDSAFLT